MKKQIQKMLEEYRSNLEPQNMVTALIVEPGKVPYVQEIGSDYQSLFCLLGGPIEGFTLNFDGVNILCNEYGKVLGLPSNRAILDSMEEPCDIIAGTFIVIGAREDSEEYSSLTAEEINKYYELFKDPVCRWRYVL